MAVYTFLSSQDIAQHLLLYDGLGTLVSATGIQSGIENTNYKIITTTNAFILTLFEQRTKAEDLPFFMRLNTHLHAKNLPTAVPIVGKDGQNLYTLKNKPCVLMSFLQGASIPDPHKEHCFSAGQTLAQLHIATKDFSHTRDNTMGLNEWRRLITACQDKTSPFEPKLDRFLMDICDQLAPYWQKDLPAGVIHADFFPDNVFFNRDEKVSGVIDFYFACTGSYAYDLMLALNPWCSHSDGLLDQSRADHFIAGYESLRPLNVAEKQTLPALGALAALRIIATRLYDALHPVTDAQVTPKNPMPYVTLLRHHLKKITT